MVSRSFSSSPSASSPSSPSASLDLSVSSSSSASSSQLSRKERALRIVSILEQEYPDASCALHYTTPFQLLISTILSAQTTDQKVNQVTKVLYKKYPTAQALAQAPLEELEQIIKTIGLYRTKARNIKKTAQMLVEKYNGKVPRSLEELVQLPGVGRKTANVVLGTAFFIPSGIVVDTHMKRLAKRWGLTTANDPSKIERDLNALIPREKWIWFSHAVIKHGRQVCTARKPKCSSCKLQEVCPSFSPRP